MKKLIGTFVLLIIISFIVGNRSKALASFATQEEFANTVITQTNCINASNILNILDTIYGNCSGAYTLSLRIPKPPTAIPSTATNVNQWFTYYPAPTGNSGSAFFNYNFGGSDCTSSPLISLTNTSPVLWSYSVCNGFSLTTDISTINTTNITMRVGQFASGTLKWDSFSSFYTYDYSASLSLTNVVASASGGITFDASGDTTFTSNNEQCKVQLFEMDTTNPNSIQFLTQAFATIFLDSTQPRSTTLYEGAGNYLGQGFSSTSSVWQAKGIAAPFFSGKNVTISASTECTHPVTNSDGSITPSTDVNIQGYLPNLSTQFVPTLNATPSALQNTTTVSQGNCTGGDLICSFEQWLTNSFCYVFCPNPTFEAVQFASLQQQFNNKVPFGYFNSVMIIDLSNTNVATSDPVLTLPQGQALATYSGQPYRFKSISPGSGIFSALSVTLHPLVLLGNITKPVISVGLWLVFIGIIIPIAYLMIK